MFDVIKDVLLRCSLPIANCIGEAYDGAANMSGVRNGVQALMMIAHVRTGHGAGGGQGLHYIQFCT